MLEYDMPITIRRQYLEDKERHEIHCEDGYITHIDIFSGNERKVRCRYCEKFNKAIFND